jgi:hypothetical protein
MGNYAFMEEALGMARTLCLLCRDVFDTDNSSIEQLQAGDESFCPKCWEKYGMKIMG